MSLLCFFFSAVLRNYLLWVSGGNLSAFSLTPEISFATRYLAERSDARDLPLMSQSRAIPSDSG
jgi:hypothetical protein